RNAGGTWIDVPLVRDGNWATSRSPLDLLQFERGMVELFEEAPRRNTPAARPRRFAQYRPTSVLGLMGGVGLHALLQRRLLAACPRSLPRVARPGALATLPRPCRKR